ncbi:DUF3467 domain-containing protein [Sphingomonas psychrotolerans]|uniref:DUF3467 domain-containing protein n=1 Tax=Sphingomonas psychrotolerans TaxID=1327635 RepID=A0ABU3N6X2_9SPHN|nr:DUF3467 domain-containing protein [Sphingomonas psychrotolerans]MDT8760264.1 DUF3467 domain-containing protein [Sphingomonas psychrotolerans]
MDQGKDEEARRALAAQAPFARLYVNHLQLAVSLSDVRIDLGQLQPGSQVPTHQVRLISSPDYLLTMQREIGGAIDRYQQQFGAIAGGAHG